MIARRLDVERALPLPNFRFEIAEAAQILRISRTQLYKRIQEGLLRPQKDGARTYLTCAELKRYIDSCNALTPPAPARADHGISRRHAKTTPRP